jgi:signal transduction histidine kinase
MTSVLDMQELRTHLTNSVIQSMHVERAALSTFRMGVWEKVAGPDSSVCALTPAILNAVDNGQVILREEAGQADYDPVLLRVAADMARMGADVAVPLMLQKELAGLLLVGPKLSGAPFSENDVVLLSTLANQAAIALRNAQLYMEVQTNQRYTRAIVEHLDSAVLTVDRHGLVVDHNEAAKQMIPQRDGEFVLPAMLRKRARRVVETGREEADIEFGVRDATGTAIPVVATVCPFVSDAGQASALIVMRDITVLRKLEDERLQSERFSSMTRTAATLAHEIRNPLASIRTFFQLLPEKYLDVEFRDGFGGVAFQEVERINTLVETLLASSKSSSDHRAGELLHARAGRPLEPVLIQDVVEYTRELVRPEMAQHGVELKLRCNPGAPPIMGDSAQLRQLFLNLLRNASQAAPSGTEVTVSVYEDGFGHVCGEVANVGEPIPADDMGRLFEPFFTTRGNGTGLGLAVCKQVAEFHGGDIAVESSRETGTVFRFRVPAEGSAS